MRRIPLKTVPIRPPGLPREANDIPFRYADNIAGIINAEAAERGLPLSEINKSLRVLGPLQAAMAAEADHMLLEDADWQHLKRLVEGFRSWRIVHWAVPAFVKDIAEAECIAPSGVLSAAT